MKGTRQSLQETTRDTALSRSRIEFKVNDEVIRFIKQAKPGGMKSIAYPRSILRLVEKVARGQWIACDASGTTYQVPEYQLKKVDSAEDLRNGLPGQEEIEPILFHPFKTGEYLVVEDTTQDGIEWTYGVYKLIDAAEIEAGRIKCSKLWWDHSGTDGEDMIWKEYPDDPPMVISPARVIANRVILRRGRLSRKLLNRLELEQNLEPNTN
jgi:hypothetical protein